MSDSRPLPGALVYIDGQPIYLAGMRDAVDAAITRLKAGLGFTLFTLNLDHLVKRRVDPQFREVYARATLVTADGAPVVWLARQQGVRLERTTGADMLAPMCEAAESAGIPIALFGSSLESLDAAAAELRRRFPCLDIRHIEAPGQGFDPASPASAAAIERIAAAGAQLCFIALGAPKQEVFADRMLAAHPHIGSLGVGAALDFISGRQKRAPLWLQRCGLEWAWRLSHNPWRLTRRYARCAWLLAELMLFKPFVERRAVNLRSLGN